MWRVVHQCEEAGLDIHEAAVLVHWLIFLKQHNAARLEEFLQKLAEGTKKKDYYNFSKYCLALYRQVHKEQLASGLHRIEKPLIEQFMQEAAEMDELGDGYHQDPKDDYWQKNASIAAPDDRELPRSYVKLLSSYDDFEAFMAAHKEFDQTDEEASARAVDAGRRRTARKVHDALKK